MISFADVMAVTRGVSGPAAFEDDECRAYYDLLIRLARTSSVMEIGLQFGRSSSVVMQVEKEIGFDYLGIDPFTDPPEARDKWFALADQLGSHATVILDRSIDIIAGGLIRRVEYPFDVVLIDGDHTECGVAIDCALALPYIPLGGYLLFHDYGRESIPWVAPTAKKILGPMKEWREERVVGTLGIWHRGDLFQ